MVWYDAHMLYELCPGISHKSIITHHVHEIKYYFLESASCITSHKNTTLINPFTDSNYK